MTSTPSRRLVFIDAARAWAIVLAFTVHAFLSFGVFDHLSQGRVLLIRSFTHAATPTFILLFGIMLEMVYTRRIRERGLAAVAPRLLKRSVQCYACYLVTVASALLVGRLTLRQGLLAALFSGNYLYSEILKFYAVALVLVIPLFWLRRRWGLAAAVAFSLALWLLTPFLKFVAWPDRSAGISGLTALFFGRPAGSSVFSMLHGLVLITAGMALGQGLAAGRATRDWRPFNRALFLVSAAALAVAVALAVHYTPGRLLVGYVTRFRPHHRAGYYALGLLESLALLFLFSRLFPLSTPYRPWHRKALVFGNSSLVTFTLGSVVLDLWPLARPGTLDAGLLHTAVYLPAMMLLVLGVRAILDRRVLLPGTPGRAAPALTPGGKESPPPARGPGDSSGGRRGPG